ncbi:glycosyltransferase [uncultured Paracoccus sp.]|uniref:glycosyltransferase n=1 Tax=uncultured Paracoccus sp. TaxID=189685 RepID=UPI00261093A2|nr:glycosyltransferase [uncultured Paracoccus sp.]HMR36359.1 glycosyltransferase [Paracoccus sp. (in: a-proteobacteria)]
MKKKVCLVLDGPEPGDDGRLALLDEFDGLADLCGAFHVDILIVGWPSISNGLRQRMTEPLRSLGAAIRFVDPSDYADIQPETAHRGKSLAIFRHLSEEGDYDIVHFLGLPWLAFYTLCARSQSTAFVDSVIVLQPDSLDSWRFREGDGLPVDAMDLILEFMEQGAVARADYLVMPSVYSLDWMRENCWTLPPEERCRVILPAAAPSEAVSGRVDKVEELIFVTSETAPNDSRVMIGALNRLAPRLVDDGIRASLLTRFHTDEFYHSGTDLIEGAEGWDFPLAIFPADQKAALKARLSAAPNAVMILAEEKPFSARGVAPAITHGVPVVTSCLGGANEVIASTQRAELTCEMTAEALAKHLASALENGLPRPIVSEAARNSRAIHSLYDEATGRFSPPASASVDLPLVTVCITHYQRIGKLREALRSVLAQTYPRIEIIVVDDGSPDAEVQAELDRLEPELHRHGGRLIRRENGYLGAARNSGAAAARGLYVCFLDDDDLALPDMVQTLVTAARSTGAEIVSGLQTPMPNSRRDEALPDPLAFPGKVEFFPLGGPLALTLTHYCLANASSLILLSAFQEIGGYTELRDVGGEDHEFYTRALQNGMRIEISPHLAYLYETGIPSMWGKHSHRRHMARVATSIELDHRAPQLRDLLLLTASDRARQLTSSIRRLQMVNSAHVDILQQLHGANDLPDQLRHLSNYAHQLGRDGIARAYHASLTSRKKQSAPEHTVPKPAAVSPGAKAAASHRNAPRDENFPEHLQRLLGDLAADADAPVFVQDARLGEIGDIVRRGMSRSSCLNLMAELGGFSATFRDRPLFAVTMFELAMRAEDWVEAKKLVDSAAAMGETAYLALYPDVAGAVEQRLQERPAALRDMGPERGPRGIRAGDGVEHGCHVNHWPGRSTGPTAQDAAAVITRSPEQPIKCDTPE